jgi:cysteine desulfurase / selenocysteine lyase
LALVHVSNSLGTINPVKQMVAMAHAVGAIAVIDGAQAGPHTHIDVQDLDADFYTLSCHKIYAPTGVGVLYGKRGWLESMPPYLGGGDMIRSVTFEKTTYADLPNKFEAGTPNIAGVIGLGAALEYLREIPTRSGLPSGFTGTRAMLQAHEESLGSYARLRLAELDGLRFTGEAAERSNSIVAFTLQGVHPHDIGTVLDSYGVAVRTGHHCCQPLMRRLKVPATTRASFGLYNSFEDANRLYDALVKVKEMFA